MKFAFFFLLWEKTCVKKIKVNREKKDLCVKRSNSNGIVGERKAVFCFLFLGWKLAKKMKTFEICYMREVMIRLRLSSIEMTWGLKNEPEISYWIFQYISKFIFDFSIWIFIVNYGHNVHNRIFYSRNVLSTNPKFLVPV